MVVNIMEYELEPLEDKKAYILHVGGDEEGYVFDTTVTASHELVDQWITTRLEDHNFEETNKKLVVGIAIQWVNVRGVPFTECPPATLQLCIDSRCLVYQLCHSYAPSAMLRYLFDFSDRFVNFVCLRCPDDFVQKLERVHSVHELRFSDGNLPIDLRPRVASTQENGLCPTLPDIAKQYLGFSELDMDNTNSNWGAQMLNESQIIYASVIAFLPFMVESKTRS